MTDPDQEHQQLIRLFEQTREVASQATLTRLAARAVEVAAAGERPVIGRWSRIPVVVGTALAAAAVLAVVVARSPSGPRRALPLTSALPPASSVRASVSGSVNTPSQTAGQEPLEEDAAESSDLSADADDGEHFELSRPRSDRELDAWLAATENVSGGS